MPKVTLNIPDVLSLEYNGLSEITVEKIFDTLKHLNVPQRVIEQLQLEPQPPVAAWRNAARPDESGWYDVHEVLPPDGMNVLCDLRGVNRPHKGVALFRNDTFEIHGSRVHISMGGQWRFATPEEAEADEREYRKNYFAGEEP